jgi:glutathione S-transferase
MSQLELISHNLCPYVQRAVIVLLEKNIDHTRTYIDLAQKPDWFAQISPLGKVPILKMDDQILFESQVIAEYLDEVTPGSLHPADPWQKAHHRAWIEYGSATLNAIGALYSASSDMAFEEKRVALREKFALLENQVEGPFFAGDQFHLVDGVWGTIFRYLDVFDQFADLRLLDEMPKVQKWRKSVAERPSVIKAAAAGYSENLTNFLIRRQSHISSLIAA